MGGKTAVVVTSGTTVVSGQGNAPGKPAEGAKLNIDTLN